MNKKRKRINKKFYLKLVKYLDAILIFILVFDYLLYPLPTLAKNAGENDYIDEKHSILVKIAEATQDEIKIVLDVKQNDNISNHLPVNKDKDIKRTGYYNLTAYNSEAAQTDASPCTTANGFNVCEHGVEDTVAANFLPFGAKVRMPDLFGDRVFIVRDRMSPRFDNYIDVWMKERSDAIKFGVKYARVEVLK